MYHDFQQEQYRDIVFIIDHNTYYVVIIISNKHNSLNVQPCYFKKWEKEYKSRVIIT